MAISSEGCLKVERSFGVGNFRQTAGFPLGKDQKYKYVCPLGPSVVIWDIESKAKEKSVQMSSDLIVCLLQNNATGLVLLLSYSGTGKIINSALESICDFQIPGNNVVYACWDDEGGSFCVCTTGPKSMVALYQFNKQEHMVNLAWLKYAIDIDVDKEVKDCCDQSINCTDEYHVQGSPPINHSCLISCSVKGLHEDANNFPKDRFYDCYYGCVFTDENTIFTVFKKHKIPCEGHLYSIDGALLKKQTLSPLGEPDASMMCLSSCKNNIISVGLQRGIFMFINCITLEIMSVFQAQGSSQVCTWDGEKLLTASYQNGALQWWSINGELIKEVSISPIDSVIHLNWSIQGKELWIGGITSLNYVCLEDDSTEKDHKGTTKFSLMFHRLAGCGLSFKNSDILATGDLSGNVMIWQKSSHIDVSQPAFQVNIAASVRSLCWHQNVLLIGTLSGDFYSWQPKEGKHDYKLAYKFQYGVLTVKKASNNDTIAVGTSGGDVYVFNIVNGNLELKLKEQVHAPMPVSGGLEKQPMEIWSISWNPQDSLLATASEDKTTIIMDVENGRKVSKITGHTTAVTSVDWKQTSLGCILVTCADDRTVRINNGEDYTLMKILKTDGIYGWYTLTYLAINPIQSLILCSTQNGFLIIWDFMNDDFLICKRMHCGSIEGLSWDDAMTSFATIGSDCVANIFELEKCAQK